MNKFITNGNYIASRTFCKQISTDFAPDIRTEIMVSFFKICSWNIIKMFDVFSVIRLNGEVDLVIEKFLEIYHFPRALVIVAKRFEKRFLRTFISKYVFPVIAN